MRRREKWGGGFGGVPDETSKKRLYLCTMGAGRHINEAGLRFPDLDLALGASRQSRDFSGPSAERSAAAARPDTLLARLANFSPQVISSFLEAANCRERPVSTAFQ